MRLLRDHYYFLWECIDMEMNLLNLPMQGRVCPCPSVIIKRNPCKSDLPLVPLNHVEHGVSL